MISRKFTIQFEAGTKYKFQSTNIFINNEKPHDALISFDFYRFKLVKVLETLFLKRFSNDNMNLFSQKPRNSSVPLITNIHSYKEMNMKKHICLYFHAQVVIAKTNMFYALPMHKNNCVYFST